MKKFLIFIFGRQSKTFKYLSILKNSVEKIIKILPLVKSNKLNFFFKIISSQYFFEFNAHLKNEIKYSKKKYKFNYKDWFSHNVNIWKNYLGGLKEIKYLEIGTFEGRSAVFIGELHNVKEITCVDTFSGSDEHDNIDFDLVYKNCIENLSNLRIPHNLIKDKSENFFKNNNKKFNLIYIDGSHFYDDVKKDFINSMKCLEDGGILICDDFYWFFYKNKQQNPISAILDCYEIFNKNLDILFVHHQIIFKKKQVRSTKTFGNDCSLVHSK